MNEDAHSLHRAPPQAIALDRLLSLPVLCVCALLLAWLATHPWGATPESAAGATLAIQAVNDTRIDLAMLPAVLPTLTAEERTHHLGTRLKPDYRYEILSTQTLSPQVDLVNANYVMRVSSYLLHHKATDLAALSNERYTFFRGPGDVAYLKRPMRIIVKRVGLLPLWTVSDARSAFPLGPQYVALWTPPEWYGQQPLTAGHPHPSGWLWALLIWPHLLKVIGGVALLAAGAALFYPRPAVRYAGLAAAVALTGLALALVPYFAWLLAL